MDDDLPEVHITKIVPGGQGIGELPDGRKAFVWNALPGEVVRVKVTKKKHSYAEAVAEEVISASPERVAPQEANYLATSPWQIMTMAAESKYKHQLNKDIFAQAKVAVPEFTLTADEGRAYGYRNKMEYSFWGDEAGLHLALHQRDSHGKQVVSGSALAVPGVDKGANSICTLLGRLPVRAGELKTIIVRSSQDGEVVASLFVKPDSFPKLQLPAGLKGLRAYHSNPRSPASVPTRLLYELGDCTLHDALLGRQFTYDADSFFQVNVPVFERALASIKRCCEAEELTDIYAGVGSIGLSVAHKAVELVEADPETAKMAWVNAKGSGLKATVVETMAEKALDYISADRPVVFDPPRAGLHVRVVARLLEVRPPQIIYLSCNPVTQARDLSTLQTMYGISYFEAFNFFPRTPHIETLAVLRRR